MVSEKTKVLFMRLIVFFDLPVKTCEDRKNYRQFRKFLVKEGYLMIQKSVYSKLVMNDTHARREIVRLQKNHPPEGLVQALKVTEKQFSLMVFITGNRPTFEEIDTTEEFLVV